MVYRTGILLLVSGPSGSGKTTLCEHLSAAGEAYYAISCTTRPPRSGEIHGEDYFFLSQEEFQAKIENELFIEHAKVHGNYYGTLKSEIISPLKAGKDVVMDIDIQGADLVRSCQDPIIRKSLVDLFVTPASEQELLNRLKHRNTDSPKVIATRMKNAIEEMNHSSKYTYKIISRSREEDYSRFHALVTAERLRQSRMAPGK